MSCCMPVLELLWDERSRTSKGGRVDTRKAKRRRSAGRKIRSGATRRQH